MNLITCNRCFEFNQSVTWCLFMGRLSNLAACMLYRYLQTCVVSNCVCTGKSGEWVEWLFKQLFSISGYDSLKVIYSYYRKGTFLWYKLLHDKEVLEHLKNTRCRELLNPSNKKKRSCQWSQVREAYMLSWKFILCRFIFKFQSLNNIHCRISRASVFNVDILLTVSEMMGRRWVESGRKHPSWNIEGQRYASGFPVFKDPYHDLPCESKIVNLMNESQNMKK